MYNTQRVLSCTTLALAKHYDLLFSDSCEIWLIVFCARCARCATCALDVSMRNIWARFAQDSLPMCNICTRFAQDCTSFSNAQYMRKICARLYFFPRCAIYAQDLRKIVLLSPMRNICARFAQDCTSFSNAQYMRKICMRKVVVISPMRNICARFVKDCTYFLNVQCMRKICARLYLFLQCAIYVQDSCKIVLLSPMHNICALRNEVQSCTHLVLPWVKAFE